MRKRECKWCTVDNIASQWLSGHISHGSLAPAQIGGNFGSCCESWKGTRQSFEGDSFYSYRTVVAKKIQLQGRLVIAVTSTDYGINTRKHLRGIIDCAKQSQIPVVESVGSPYRQGPFNPTPDTIVATIALPIQTLATKLVRVRKSGVACERLLKQVPGLLAKLRELQVVTGLPLTRECQTLRDAIGHAGAVQGSLPAEVANALV